MTGTRRERTTMSSEMTAWLDQVRDDNIKLRDVPILEAREVYLRGAQERLRAMQAAPVFDTRRVDGVDIAIFRRADAQADAKQPVLLCHGGGFLLGGIGTHADIAQELAEATGRVVVLADYRRAPEHPHPAAVEDCVAVARWLINGNATNHPSNIGLCGDSAGGAIALLVAEVLNPHVDATLLVYPALDPSLGSPSAIELHDGYGLTRADMDHFWQQYLGSTAPGNLFPVSARLQPPTVLLTAEWDVLHDEALAFAHDMSTAARPVQHVEGRGLIHGFLDFRHAVPSAAQLWQEAMAKFSDLLDSSRPANTARSQP